MRRAMRLKYVLYAAIVAALAVSAFAFASSSSTKASSSSTSQQNITVNGVFHWRNLGGDPLKSGGVKSAAEARAVLASPNGVQAMRLSGATSAQVSATASAKLSSCKLVNGQRLPSTSFGNPVRVEKDVQYDGPTTSAYCWKVSVGQPTVTMSSSIRLVKVVKNNDGSKTKIYRATKVTTTTTKMATWMIVGACANIAPTGKTKTTVTKTVQRSESRENIVAPPVVVPPTPIKVVVACTFGVSLNGYVATFSSTPVVVAGKATATGTVYNPGIAGAGASSVNTFQYPNQDGSYTPSATVSFTTDGGPVTATCTGAVVFRTATVNVPTPGPTVYTASGATSVVGHQVAKAACPAPNQHINKSGEGNSLLTSPTFSGTGSNQAGAQAAVDAQLASWRTANQPTVDSDALAKANTALTEALKGCPSPPVTVYNVTGTATITSHQEVSSPCPCYPDIVKYGSGDASRTSPTFTGTGSTQAAAQADLDAQLNTWKSANQAAVDAEALAEANNNLEIALEECPDSPPPPPPPSYECTAEFQDRVVLVGDTAHLIIEPNGPMKSFVVDWGPGYAPGNDYNAYTTPGVREVTATVTYEDGSTSSCSDTVDVIPCPPDPPVCGEDEQWDEESQSCKPCPPEKPEPPKCDDDVDTNVGGQGHDDHGNGNGYGHCWGGKDHNGDAGPDTHGHNGKDDSSSDKGGKGDKSEKGGDSEDDDGWED